MTTISTFSAFSLGGRTVNGSETVETETNRSLFKGLFDRHTLCGSCRGLSLLHSLSLSLSPLSLLSFFISSLLLSFFPFPLSFLSIFLFFLEFLLSSFLSSCLHFFSNSNASYCYSCKHCLFTAYSSFLYLFSFSPYLLSPP